MKILIRYFVLGCFCLSALFFPAPVLADEIITHLDVGEPAPFSGTLLNPEAAARILVDLENQESACQIIIDTELGRQAADYQLQLASATAALSACEIKLEDLLTIKNDQIDFLEAQLQKPKIFTKEVTFVLGVVTGIAVTAVAGYTMAQVAGD